MFPYNRVSKAGLMGEEERGEEQGVFGLVVTFTLRPESAAGFDELTGATVAEICRLEPGTILYLVHRVEGAPRKRLFYEPYRDREAFAVHEATAHVRRFLAERSTFVEAVQVDRVEPTHGLPHPNV